MSEDKTTGPRTAQCRFCEGHGCSECDDLGTVPVIEPRPLVPGKTVRRPTVTRDGDVVIGGKWVGTVIREPGPPPNWTVLGSSGSAISWHYLRRDAVEEVKRRHGNG